MQPRVISQFPLACFLTSRLEWELEHKELTPEQRKRFQERAVECATFLMDLHKTSGLSADLERAAVAWVTHLSNLKGPACRELDLPLGLLEVGHVVAKSISTMYHDNFISVRMSTWSPIRKPRGKKS